MDFYYERPLLIKILMEDAKCYFFFGWEFVKYIYGKLKNSCTLEQSLEGSKILI